MAQFPTLQFTQQGLQMLIQAQNNHTLTFTCGKLGSGTLGDSEDPSAFTDLKTPKMTLPITNVDDSNPEKLVLTFDASNTGLEEGFISRELGVFAKLDEGAETLYAYSNAGNNYDYIPNKDTPSDENRIVVNLVVSSSANISVTIDSSIVYVHRADVEKMIAAHNTDEDAHANLALLINDALAPTKDNDTLKNLLSGLAYMITKITGKDDWKAAPVISIAAILSSLSDNVAVNWDSNKFTVPALGVSGLMAQNGYINFGKLFGGLIVQWGMQEGYITLPISATVLISVVCNRQDSGEYADVDNFSQTGVAQYANAISTWSWYAPSDGSPHSLNWIAICKQ